MIENLQEKKDLNSHPLSIFFKKDLSASNHELSKSSRKLIWWTDLDISD